MVSCGASSRNLFASAIGITFMLVLIALTAIQFRLSRKWTYYE